MGSLLRRTPHTLVVKKPKEKKDAESNASYLDYADLESTRSVKGQFQARGGITSIAGEGQEVPFDAMFYTKDTIIADDDHVEVILPGVTATFIVIGTQPKYRIGRGQFSHNEVTLQKVSKQ